MEPMERSPRPASAPPTTQYSFPQSPYHDPRTPPHSILMQPLLEAASSSTTPCPPHIDKPRKLSSTSTTITISNTYNSPVQSTPTDKCTPYAQLLRFPVHRSIYQISGILLMNLLFMILIALCLYIPTRQESLSQTAKRIFNVGIMLTSALLSVGIGSLLDNLGLMARGRMLASGPHTTLSIRYIIQGSMASVAHLLQHHMFRRPRTFNRTTLMALLYLVFSACARLSVAFIGLTFNVDESLHRDVPVEVSIWPSFNQQFTDITTSETRNLTLDALYDYAILGVRSKSPDTEARNANLTADTNAEVRATIGKAFTAKEVRQTLTPGKSIATFEYALREFVGGQARPSNRTVVVQTECETYVVPNGTTRIIPGQLSLVGTVRKNNITFTSAIFDPEKYPLDGFAEERIFMTSDRIFPSSCGPLCVRLWLWDKFLNTPGEATYVCENRLNLTNSALNQTYSAGTSTTTKAHQQADISYSLAEAFLRFTGDSETSGNPTDDPSGFHHRSVTDIAGFTNFANAIGLDSNYPNGEIWVASVLARFTSVLILYLDNEILPKMALSDSRTYIRSNLLVHWGRVWALVSVLAATQIFLAIGTIWYCKGSVLLPDEVSPLGALMGEGPKGLAIPRSSTFSSLVEGHRRVDEGEVQLRAWFRLASRAGVRRWVLEFDEGPQGLLGRTPQSHGAIPVCGLKAKREE